jgi:hypothetical protein
VVNLWWNRGELWCLDGRILGLENLPLLEDLFLRDSRFGNRRRPGPSQTPRAALENATEAHPPAKLTGPPISDDETVAMIGHRNLLWVRPGATYPPKIHRG